MRIKELSLKNFKGIRDLTVRADGKDVNIWGDNATGKTTIFDAFNWLLFGKDSLNRADFNIKPIDPETKEIVHGLETEVETVLDLGGSTIKLRKVYSEKWEKKPGSAERTMTGHTTDCFVDDIPKKKGDYELCIHEIADEKVSKMLTNPLHFSENLHWTERRKILLEVCGDITDSEVIETNPKLAQLTNILVNHSLEDQRKIIAANKAKINEKLKEIPVRITEVSNGILDVAGINVKEISNEISALQAKDSELRQSVSRIQAGGEIAQKQKRVAEINAELINLKNKHEQLKADSIRDLRTKESALSSAYNAVLLKCSMKENEVKSTQMSAESLQNDLTELREQWSKVNAEKFIYFDYIMPEQKDTCPACGQSIPKEQLYEALEKDKANYLALRESAEKAFNYDKSLRLAKINERGVAVGKEHGNTLIRLAQLNKEFTDLQNETRQAKRALDEVQQQIAKTLAEISDVTNTTEYSSKEGELSLIQIEIAELQKGSAEEVCKLMAQINSNSQGITALQTKLAQRAQAEKATLRIAELKADEKKLASEYEKLEEELFLTEEFIRTKVRMLESKINSKFKVATFKLFNTQVNGALEECCEVCVGGVPYSDLNKAMKINSGMDIISALTEFYNFDAPIFIDNAEAVTRLADIKAQVIRLIVSEKDKVLKIERGE